MNKMKKYAVIFYVVFFGLLLSCENEGKLEKEKSQNNNIIKKCKKQKPVFRTELNLFKREGQNLDSILKKGAEVFILKIYSANR